MVEQEALELVQAPLSDRYTIERAIGRGGTATVYLATEAKHGRQVAIKVLHPDFTSAVGADRFLREIRIAARLSHPHLVPLIDSGEAGGLLFYVSAFIDGGSLRDRLRHERRLPIADAVRVVREAGAGLDFAHRAGIVHRDVKPENILFADGMALLADFGIARATCTDVAELVTAAGLAVGTPEYMSPEQASGDQELGARSDIYSLACVLFEALTGEPPFRAGSSRATVAKHMFEVPRRVRALRPEVPAPIDDAIAKALAKEPEQRWGSVPDFLAALEVVAPARGHVYVRATRSVAVLPFVNASPEAENDYLSDGITDELIDALAKVEGLRVASRTSVFALKGQSLDVRAIGALLDCGYVLEGTVRRSGARLRITAQLTSTQDGRLLWSQRYDRQLDDVLEIQDEIARTIVNTLRATSFAALSTPAPRRHTWNARAHRLYLQGRYEWSRRTQAGVAAGIRFFEEAIAEDPNYALAWTGLADCYALDVDYRSIPVDEGFTRAKEYARRAIGIDDTLSEAHCSLAWSLFVYDWDWAGSEREFRRAIDLDPRNATAHQWYAFVLHARGQVGEGLVEGHTAVELEGGNVSARRSLAWGYYYARRYDQARFHLDRALVMDPNAEETYRVLGVTLAMEGAYEDALQVMEETVAMPGAGSYSQATLGYVLARMGRRAEAEGIQRALEAEAARGYVSPVAMATLQLGLGDVECALDWTERALEARRGWLAYLRVNPMMDPMRGHPRFERLIERMGL